MLRGMGFFACIATVTLWSAGTLQADSLAWSGDRVAFTNDSFTLSPDLTDWWLGSGNTKLGGSAFSTSNMPSVYSDPDYPHFSYSDGTNPNSAVDEQGTYAYGVPSGEWIPTNSSTLNVVVQPGSGRVNFWCGGGQWGEDDAGVYVTAVLGSQTINAGTYDPSNAGRWKYTLDYTNTSLNAETMTVSLQPFYSAEANTGFFAATLEQIPEPATMTILITGLAGLLAYAWRKQR